MSRLREYKNLIRRLSRLGPPLALSKEGSLSDRADEVWNSLSASEQQEAELWAIIQDVSDRHITSDGGVEAVLRLIRRPADDPPFREPTEE